LYRYGTGEKKRERKMASPVTYKVTLPRDYDADRAEPYPMLIVVGLYDLTHSLKASGFKLTHSLKSTWFQPLMIRKCDLLVANSTCTKAPGFNP
jgi:hypothetical protein